MSNMSIESNLYELRERVARAAERSGRSIDDITIVAVSKYSQAEDVIEAARCGQTIFAENRVQMLNEKLGALDELRGRGVQVPDMKWHLIGHLQTNKVRQVVGKVELIHSVDSERVLDEIVKCSAAKGITSDILIEVNVSGEESKFGISFDEMDALIEACASKEHIKLRGLMTMAPKGAPENEARKIFSKLREKFLDKQYINVHNIDMTYLSMGMSADFECAIDEGSNMIRVGHSIFL